MDKYYLITVSYVVLKCIYLSIIPLFHGGNTGSNPVGPFNCLYLFAFIRFAVIFQRLISLPYSPLSLVVHPQPRKITAELHPQYILISVSYCRI